MFAVTYQWMKNKLYREDGQAMAEYGIILALVAVAVIGTVYLLGGQINDAFNSIVNGLKDPSSL